MNDELWRVQLSTGEIRMMTIDALDRAFDEGLIDARVPVLPPGASAWTTLGEAAGLEDDSPTEQTPSLSPFAIANPAPSSADVVAPLAPDTKPAIDDLDLPDSFDELRQRSKRGLVIGAAAGALAVAAAVAVLAGQLGSSAPVGADVSAIEAPTKAAAAEQAPPPAAVETLPPPAAKEAAPPSAAPASKPELSDWQKRMLADADKAREDKARVKAQERPKQAPTPKPKPATSNGLLNGGDKFDPLNGAL